MDFENKPMLGYGIYTVTDIAKILNLRYYKVQRLLNEYWDNRIAKDLGERYSWTDGKSKAVSFHTLVEFYTFFQLREAGIKTQEILKAHQDLSKKFDTAFPFATDCILKLIRIAGKKVLFQISEDEIIDLDFTGQFNIHFLVNFMKKLDFQKEDDMASRLWPLGKKRKIVVDPKYQFGHPTIEGTRILTRIIYGMSLADEPIPFIAKTYGISVAAVKDAIYYCSKEAA